MLKTTRVPAELASMFVAAEEVVARYFRGSCEDPERGTIEIFGERYILVRGAALSVELFGLLEQVFGAGREREADLFGRNLLFDLAQAIGKSDARNLQTKMGLRDSIAKFAAGPAHFAHSGWASVDILAESHPTPDADFYLLYDHPYSFESDAWLRAGKSREFPVCVMNAGYSSGWCAESFRLPLVASEVMCRVKGDETCRFIMAPPAKIDGYVRKYLGGQATAGTGTSTYTAPDFFARKRREVELARLYDRLKELDRVKSELFANVTRELRTPLMLMTGPIDRLLASGKLDDEQRRDLETVRAHARTLLTHVNDVVVTARIDTVKMPMDYAEVDLSELVRLVSRSYDALARERNITYSVSVDEPLRAEVDGEKLRQVLSRVLAKAFQFARTKVRVSLCAIGANAHIEIADDGASVPMARRVASFDGGRRGDGGAAGDLKSTGLDLAIARDLVHRHGGRISVAPAHEGGGMFVVELPLSAPEGVPVARAERPLSRSAGAIASTLASGTEGVPPAVQASPDAPLVLLVEGESDMLRLVTSTLDGEYRVEIAEDGQRGFEKACALTPDLIITDVMVPRLSGEDLVLALREREHLAATPIIVLTAKTDDELKAQLLGRGAQDYIVKPFTAGELRARVRNCVAMKRVRDILSAELATTSANMEQLALALASKKRELQDALQAMRIARDHAERASRTKTMFLRLVTHELATPLQTMRLSLDALQRRVGDLQPAHAEKLAKLERASNRLLDITRQLLEFVRAESGALEVRREEVCLPKLSATVVDDLGSLAREKGLELHVHIGEHVPPANTDARLVRIVLANLVGNAIKYTDVGRIDVAIEFADGAFRITVSDTGHGIPPEKQAAIFEPFTQLESIEYTHTLGAGLGLMLVREIVKALGGHIQVSSRVGQGSVFTVVLPEP